MKEVNSMDCAQFENIVDDIERPGTEGFALRDLALAHAESCSHCAQLMTETESLDAGLRMIMAAAATQTAPPGVEAALMAEFRRRHFLKARRRVQRQIAALGTAAAALLAIGFSLHHWSARRDTPPPEVAVVRNVPASPPGATAPNSATELDADDSEYAGSFTPLPYADDPSALEDGAVVRVEMPRAALASFGLPVAAMESDGTVRADLIVSADGTPQAIRLVSQDNTTRE
jgi:hypothetical protein